MGEGGDRIFMKIHLFRHPNQVLSLGKSFLSTFGWFLDILVGPGASNRYFLKNPVLTLRDLFSTVWTVSAFGYSPKRIYLFDAPGPTKISKNRPKVLKNDFPSDKT